MSATITWGDEVAQAISMVVGPMELISEDEHTYTWAWECREELPQFELTIDTSPLWDSIIPDGEVAGTEIRFGDYTEVRRLGIWVTVPRHTHIPRARMDYVQINEMGATASWVAMPNDTGESMSVTIGRVTLKMWLGALWETVGRLLRRG